MSIALDINFDLLSIGFAIAGVGVLGFLVYFNNRLSITNKTFLIFSILTIFWAISNYIEYRFTTTTSTLWALRWHLYISIWHALFFFQLCMVIPRESIKFPNWYKFFTIPLVIIVSVLTLTPLVFKEILELAPVGQVTDPVRGPGLLIFALVALGLLIAGLFILFRKTIRSRGLELKQNTFFLVGMFSLAILILFFNVFLPVVLKNLRFIPFAGLFVLPFMILMSYAIYKHRFFNIKVAATGLLVFVLSVVTFLEIIFIEPSAENAPLFILRISVFVLILIFGILLIKGVLREVSLREQLEEANEAQTTLIHFITHQVKGFFTKSRNIFAGILEGDYGEIGSNMKPVIEEGFNSDTKAVDTVQDILKASNIRRGTVTYNKKQFDFKELVHEELEKQKRALNSKGITLETEIDEAGHISLVGDRDQLEHVIHNLIDNAIKYTPQGKILVRLSKENDKIRFSVKDSGVGISPEDMKNLFTEGGRGKDSVKVNVESTGYGLFIVKNIVEAHNGKVWAESEGAGKGSTFIVELKKN